MTPAASPLGVFVARCVVWQPLCYTAVRTEYTQINTLCIGLNRRFHINSGDYVHYIWEISVKWRDMEPLFQASNTTYHDVVLGSKLKQNGQSELFHLAPLVVLVPHGQQVQQSQDILDDLQPQMVNSQLGTDHHLFSMVQCLGPDHTLMIFSMTLITMTENRSQFFLYAANYDWEQTTIYLFSLWCLSQLHINHFGLHTTKLNLLVSFYMTKKKSGGGTDNYCPFEMGKPELSTGLGG